MDLDVWLTKIRQTRSHAEVFAVLDEFRTHEWADDQRSKVAKLYMRMLENFGPITNDEPIVDDKDGSHDKKKDAKEPKAKSGKTANDLGNAALADQAGASAAQDEKAPSTTGSMPVEDEPVWYEKM